MNKVKHIAIAISALSVMGVASVSLASNCPTTISPSTATCLSNTADKAFQKNYQTEYTKQKAGLGGAYFSEPNNSNTSTYSAPKQQTQEQQEPEQEQVTSNNTTPSNPIKKSKSSIRWF